VRRRSARRWQHVSHGDDRAELHALYARYLQRCNEHRFSELAEFVADDVEVNDAAMGLAGYGDG
jgi:predicted ester cyclase